MTQASKKCPTRQDAFACNSAAHGSDIDSNADVSGSVNVSGQFWQRARDGNVLDPFFADDASRKPRITLLVSVGKLVD